MRLKRIANERYPALDGGGGLHVNGRWHSVGRPVVYLAGSTALALLELTVHMELPLAALPLYVLIDVDVPDDVSIEEADFVDVDEAVCRAFGDAWLASARTALCRVRSVIVRDEFNYLMNPLHPDAQSITVVTVTPFSIDPRLPPSARVPQVDPPERQELAPDSNAYASSCRSM